MNEYTFWIPITGAGREPWDAWANALECLREDIFKGKYAQHPEAMHSTADEIPTELLVGPLSDGFGIEHARVTRKDPA